MWHLSDDQAIFNRKFVLGVLLQIFSDPFHNPFVPFEEDWPPQLGLQIIFALLLFWLNKETLLNQLLLGIADLFLKWL